MAEMLPNTYYPGSMHSVNSSDSYQELHGLLQSLPDVTTHDPKDRHEGDLYLQWVIYTLGGFRHVGF